MISSFRFALADWLAAPALMFRHGLWRVCLLAGLLSLVVMVLLVALPAWALVHSDLSEVLMAYYPWQWGREGLTTLLDSLLVVLVLLFMFLFAAKHIVMLISGPLMTDVSQKLEAALTGQPAPDELPLLPGLWRGARLALRYASRELMLLLAFFPFSFIPVIGVGFWLLGLLVQAYYAGAGAVDYTLERYRFTTTQSVAFNRRHRQAVILLGLPYLLLLMVPVIGWFFAPVLVAIAATRNTLRYLEADKAKPAV